MFRFYFLWFTKFPILKCLSFNILYFFSFLTHFFFLLDSIFFIHVFLFIYFMYRLLLFSYSVYFIFSFVFIFLIFVLFFWHLFLIVHFILCLFHSVQQRSSEVHWCVFVFLLIHRMLTWCRGSAQYELGLLVNPSQDCFRIQVVFLSSLVYVCRVVELNHLQIEFSRVA